MSVLNRHREHTQPTGKTVINTVPSPVEKTLVTSVSLQEVAFLEGIGIQKLSQAKKDAKCDEEVIEQRSKEVCSCCILVVQGCSLMSV